MGLSYLWFVVVLVALVVVASVFTLVTRTPSGSPTAFRLSGKVDRSGYRPGDRVRLSGRGCSKSWWWFTEGTGRSGGVRVAWRVLDEAGRTVADTSHRVHTLELSRQIWWPRQCRGWDDEWDLHYWNRPDQPRSFAGPARGDAVPAGKYRVEAQWRVACWPSASHGATHTWSSPEFDVRPSG